MIMTYINRKYRLNGENEDARELVKELAQCIKMLTQDLIEMDKENMHQIAVMITRDLMDVCPAPTDAPSNGSA